MPKQAFIIQSDLRRLANSDKAKILSRFFKTGKGEYGEGDKFLGVTVPQIRSLVKKYFLEISILETVFLLSSKFHEERLLALLILVKKYEKGNEKDRKYIFQTYLKNTKFINNWDLVDLTAPNIVGNFLKNKDRNILYRLAKSKSLWERRIAILATFEFIKNGEHEDTFRIAEILLKDEHDLIHKAVGWMLREVGKRCLQKKEEEFLEKYASKMPRVALRYAVERLEKSKKDYFISKKGQK